MYKKGEKFMTNKDEQIQFLIEARDMLDRVYIPWQADDGKGGHCHIGVLSKMYDSYKWWDKEILSSCLLDKTCIDMHPELAGESRVRLDLFGSYDHFNMTPCIFVNNHLGKDAILAVYDQAIQRLRANHETDMERDRR